MPKRLSDIISPYYQDLIMRCEKNKISINLDIQDLTIKIPDDKEEVIKKFLQDEIRRAVKNCHTGDKITLAETSDEKVIKISIKNSGAETLSTEQKNKLIESGYEVRARFGYDTIISLKLNR